MSQILNISTKPTFDLIQYKIENLDLDNHFIYLQSQQIFAFDQVYGTIINRSRVVRSLQDQSKIIENVIGAVIDAGFCGYLFWKVKLTDQGVKQAKHSDNEVFLNQLAKAQQLWLIPHNGANYYQGSNQTYLIPDIIFTK